MENLVINLDVFALIFIMIFVKPDLKFNLTSNSYKSDFTKETYSEKKQE